MEKINRVVIGKHTVNGRKTIANEKHTVYGRELWLMKDKEVKHWHNYHQWKKPLHVVHVGV